MIWGAALALLVDEPPALANTALPGQAKLRQRPNQETMTATGDGFGIMSENLMLWLLSMTTICDFLMFRIFCNFPSILTSQACLAVPCSVFQNTRNNWFQELQKKSLVFYMGWNSGRLYFTAKFANAHSPEDHPSPTPAPGPKAWGLRGLQSRGGSVPFGTSGTSGSSRIPWIPWIPWNVDQGHQSASLYAFGGMTSRIRENSLTAPSRSMQTWKCQYWWCQTE